MITTSQAPRSELSPQQRATRVLTALRAASGIATASELVRAPPLAARLEARRHMEAM